MVARHEACRLLRALAAAGVVLAVVVASAILNSGRVVLDPALPLVVAVAGAGLFGGLRGGLLAAILAVAYILLIVEGIGAEGGGFGSIGEIRALFANDAALVAGWFHYLAFDLFVGTWIVRDGIARDIAGWKALLLIPCLVLTFLFGPDELATRPTAERTDIARPRELLFAAAHYREGDRPGPGARATR